MLGQLRMCVIGADQTSSIPYMAQGDKECCWSANTVDKLEKYWTKQIIITVKQPPKNNDNIRKNNKATPRKQ